MVPGVRIQSVSSYVRPVRSSFVFAVVFRVLSSLAIDFFLTSFFLVCKEQDSGFVKSGNAWRNTGVSFLSVRYFSLVVDTFLVQQNLHVLDLELLSCRQDWLLEGQDVYVAILVSLEGHDQRR